MLSVQRIYDIASAYEGLVADRMVAACVAWFLERGVMPLDPRRPGARALRRVDRERRGGRTRLDASPKEPRGEVDWARMVEGNRGIRPTHV